MSTTTTIRRPAADEATPAPQPLAGEHHPRQPGERVVVHGDFNCPWSHLAYRRATVLAGSTGTAGTVDWRAVEHAPWTPGVRDDRRGRYEALADQARLVTALVMPGESLPFSAAGFVPRTWATVTAYAEAYACGVGGRVLRLLFDSYWQDGTDVGDPTRLREMLQDELRGAASTSEVVREWGYPVDLAGAPVSGRSRELVRTWQAEWRDAGAHALPVVQVGDRPPLTGARGVDWLGQEVRARRLAPDLPALSRPATPAGLPSRSWISGFGGAWLERSQRAAAAEG